MTAKTTEPKAMSLSTQRMLYGLFLLISCYYLFRGDLVSAGSNLCIGLIVDPFNGIEWQQRKGWQKAWLIVHLAIALALMITGYIQN